jgi:hypothetical protein
MRRLWEITDIFLRRLAVVAAARRDHVMIGNG